MVLKHGFESEEGMKLMEVTKETSQLKQSIRNSILDLVEKEVGEIRNYCTEEHLD